MDEIQKRVWTENWKEWGFTLRNRKCTALAGLFGSVIGASILWTEGPWVSFLPRARTSFAGSVTSPGPGTCRRQPISEPLSHCCFSLSFSRPSTPSENQWKRYPRVTIKKKKKMYRYGRGKSTQKEWPKERGRTRVCGIRKAQKGNCFKNDGMVNCFVC